MHLHLERKSDNGVQTTGTMFVHDESNKVIAQFSTLELPFKNNERRVSCIPTGVYQLRRWFSVRFGACFVLFHVANRDGILIHQGNFNSQTKGCILVGHGYSDINGDFQIDVLNSKRAMSQLRVLVTASTTIEITNKFK